MAKPKFKFRCAQSDKSIAEEVCRIKGIDNLQAVPDADMPSVVAEENAVVVGGDWPGSASDSVMRLCSNYGNEVSISPKCSTAKQYLCPLCFHILMKMSKEE